MYKTEVMVIYNQSEYFFWFWKFLVNLVISENHVQNLLACRTTPSSFRNICNV